jgi:hypothetical protein
VGVLWEPKETSSVAPEVEIVLDRVASLKRVLFSLPNKVVDLPQQDGEDASLPLAVRVMLCTGTSAQGQVGTSSKPHEGLVRLYLSFDQFVRLYYYCSFYRENFTSFEAVVSAAHQLLHNAGIENEPIEVEISAYRKVPGVYRRLASGVSLLESEVPMEVHDVVRGFLHTESLTSIWYGTIRPYFTEEGAIALEQLLSLKLLMARSFNPKFHGRFVIFGSTVPFAHGVRFPQEIDILVNANPTSVALRNAVDKAFIKAGQRRFQVYMKGLGAWNAGDLKGAYEEWFCDAWPGLLGVDTANGMVSDERATAYFLGLRISSLRADIIRRIHRPGPSAVADLIVLKRIPELSQYLQFEVPTFPEYYWANFQKYPLQGIDRPKFVRTVNAYLKDRYNFVLPEPTLWSLLSPE